MTPTPPTVPKPRLAQWLFERALDYADAGGALGVTPETVRRWCMPFDDPRRTVPGRDALERISAWTANEIVPADFYPPHLNSSEGGLHAPQGAS